MSEGKFQFGVLDILMAITAAGLLTAFISNPEPPRSWLVVAAGMVAVWIVAGRANAENRRPTGYEIRRLLLTVVGLTIATVIFGAIVIVGVVKYIDR